MIEPLPIRIGHGYDLHRLVAGRKLILGGVELPFHLGLLGHSDADCLTHALADAIFGALSLPDIGHYFPDNNSANKDLDSKVILIKAVSEADRIGYQVGNIDLTIVAEKPKILHYIEKIKISLSSTMDLPKERIGIKATTNEQIGAIGRMEGIATFAVCTLIKK
ncbi:MAG: 2-C-methyl-D-erythritol 2,4-cyclodiphosphate synthase [Opitutales bacterium]|nr:2-C-methyl-D-erythritol 2,4-cyclodiphosphate synthase [Opitutales bacterium]MDG1325599.1 2-C-methyl-D-erythritol 2,4-cyclodiphosphate synthase [Opitutales bacterium]